MSRPALLALALLGVVAGVVLWVFGGGDEAGEVPELAPAVDFPGYGVPEAVTDAWPTEAPEVDPDSATAAFLDEWRAANVVHALQTLELFEGDPDAVLIPFESTARDFATHQSAETLDRASHAAFATFESGLGELLRKATLTETPVRAVLTNPADATAQLAYEACGDFPLFALQQGLIGEAGDLRVTRDVLRLLFRYRWYHQFRAVRPVDQLMPGPELRAFRRWRMERAEMEADDRARLVAEFDATYGLDAYPRRFADGVVAWQRGDREAAIDAFEEAVVAAPDDAWIAGVLARARSENESN